MEKDDKKIEALIDKLMSADTLEHPSAEFTDKVMAQVEAFSNSTATVYKPLISKPVWMLLVSGAMALVAYIYFKTPSDNNRWFDKLGLSDISINPFETITLNFSTTFVYAVVLFALMLCIQIPVLKHYFNKRMAF